MRKIKNLEKTCEVCPAQWEGEFEDGTPIYIRYRWGWLTVSEGVEGKEIFSKEIDSSGWEGVLDEKDMLRITGLEYE